MKGIRVYAMMLKSIIAVVMTTALYCINPARAGNPEREAYYGDLHLHTTYSFDVYLGSNITPDDAYRFARGESVTFLNEVVKRSTPPLDFLAVTDHAENLGVFNTLGNPKSPLSQSQFGQQVHKEGGKQVGRATVQLFDGVKDLSEVVDVSRHIVKASANEAWQHEIEAANRNYQPGKFTTFIGYEWSSQPGMANLHRNIIFRGESAPLPFSAADSNKPEDLWAFLDRSRRQGFDALAIPHNANASDGLMFNLSDSSGKPIDQTYAKQRAANEPLVEIVQQAGQSETHPVLSPNDEFADFEVMDFLAGFRKSNSSMAAGSYARDALGRGMEVAQRVGVNPFKYGFVGGSDAHTGLSDSSETALAELFARSSETEKSTPEHGNALSEQNRVEGLRDQLRTRYPTISRESAMSSKEMYAVGSPGLTAVWAEQNTRESIFLALRRKETFATSGTRLKFRFFGGWHYPYDLPKTSDWVKAAYHGGVPMGGDLPTRPSGEAGPTFAIWAIKDPNSAKIDRLQVVKVCLDNGSHKEAVFDVALSNGGAVQLSTVWRDNHFDPRTPAAYYLRVLEVPTPRYSTIVAAQKGLPVPEGVPATIQERGWSSPIWYTPPEKIAPSGTK